MTPVERTRDGVWELDGIALREGELLGANVFGNTHVGTLHLIRGVAWIVSRRGPEWSETRVRVGLLARRIKQRRAA